MPTLKNLTGFVFGRLKVLSYQGKEKWLCECSCGNKSIVFRSSLKQGNTKSCGCLHDEVAKVQCAKNTTTHGCTVDPAKKPTYCSWQGMKARCLNSNNPNFKKYGGRGIEVCESWMKFENFINDMGIRIPGMSIERLDNNGNYEPSNCIWATSTQQARNKRNTRFVILNGEKCQVSEAADRIGISRRKLYKHLRFKGWPNIDVSKLQLNS